MKRVLKIVLLLLFGFNSLSAQVGIGIRGGLNLANWAANDVVREELRDNFGTDEFKSVNNLLFGALIEIRLMDNLAIQPEINFIQKGSQFSSSLRDPVLGSVELDGRYSFNYLEVPLMLKVGTGFGVGRFDVLLGPSFGYALNGKTKVSLSFKDLDRSETNTEEIDFDEDEISRTDLGAQLGASLGLNLGPVGRLFVDGRYLLGFTNLDKHEHGSGEEPSVKNRGIALTAGLIFSF
ncbi:MAG: PorT family protein [Saprospiraceae bacterium]|nr:PorT family protein [Saprospiraceae bacterium]MDW8483062.1 porin family protein [Saprospiraceae bacterium]